MIITTKGTALSDGIFGEQIKVKNDKNFYRKLYT